MRRVAVEQQSWIMQGMWFLPPFIFMALVAGFPWQTLAQTPCPRGVQCVPDGVLTVTFSISGDTAGCVFNGTVNWGDGVINNVSNIRVVPNGIKLSTNAFCINTLRGSQHLVR